VVRAPCRQLRADGSCRRKILEDFDEGLCVVALTSLTRPTPDVTAHASMQASTLDVNQPSEWPWTSRRIRLRSFGRPTGPATTTVVYSAFVQQVGVFFQRLGGPSRDGSRKSVEERQSRRQRTAGPSAPRLPQTSTAAQESTDQKGHHVPVSPRRYACGITPPVMIRRQLPTRRPGS
jgi:hypothetical protein